MRSVLPRLTTLGGLLGIKTAPVLPRLAPLASAFEETMRVTVPHAFDAVAVTARTTREIAATMCPWLPALPGDELALEVDAISVTAWSDEAALPGDAPHPLPLHADDFALLGFDGAAWTYTLELENAADTVNGTLALLEELAVLAGVTEAQRRIAAELHAALERGRPSRLSVRARDGALDPRLGVAWDRVEWGMIQSMLKGFHPAGGGVEKIARLSRTVDADHATVELVLGPVDPPAMRITFDV
ncbi:MAG: hypothetical protein AB7T06_33905 [Kofleriaceae bacterium]